MTSDVTSLETYQNTKSMDWSETWINLIYMDFLTLLNTLPALSWDQPLRSFSWVNKYPAGKANRSLIIDTVLVLTNHVCLRVEQWLLHQVHVHPRDNCDIRRTLYSTPRPSRPHTMRVSRYNRSIARRWKVFRVPLTKKCLRAPFVASNKITSTT